MTAELDVDFAKEKTVVFDQAWRLLRDNFFDPKFNGVDWQAARARVEPYIAGARTPDEMRRIAGADDRRAERVAPRHQPAAGRPASGRGRTPRARFRSRRVRSDRTPQDCRASSRSARRRSAPASSAATYLLAVDGEPIGRQVNLDALLDNKVNRRVVLKIAKDAAGAGARDVAVRPIAAATERGLRYRQWVDERRDYVAKASGGRLGYVHMPDMSAASLAQLYVDLDADNIARDGVVIDVRNNNGGFVNVYALDVLSRRRVPEHDAARRADGAGALGRSASARSRSRPSSSPTSTRCRDAEDFTEGYRALGLGKVVGEPTAGWIIYTWNTRLLDGSILRLPRSRITDRNGRRHGDAPAPGRRRGEAADRRGLRAARTRSSTRRSRSCSRRFGRRGQTGVRHGSDKGSLPMFADLRLTRV